MKKYFKKISALLMAAIMVLSMCTSVFAATGRVPKDSDKGKVTVSGLEAGDTVTIYKIVKADYDPNGNGLIGYSPVVDGSIKNVSAPTTAEIANLMENTSLTPVDPEKTVAKDATSVEFTGLEVGMYLVKVEAGEGSLTVYNPMVASIYYKVEDNQTGIKDGAVSADQNWTIENATAYAKSSKDTTPDKKIVDIAKNGTVTVNGTAAGLGDAVAKGDKVSYQITGKIPSYDPQYYTVAGTKYIIYDEISSGLDFVPTVQADLQKQADAEFGENHATVAVEGRKITITLDPAYILSIAHDEEARSYSFTYSAVLNGTSINFDAATNSVKVNYSNTPETDTNSHEKTTYHYTFKFQGEVVKVDENNEKLPDAVFGLFEDADCKTAANYKDTNTQITATSATTTGELNFTGLDNKVYYMKEISAPNDYRLNNTIYKIEIKATFDDSTGKMKSYWVKVTDTTTNEEAKTEYKVGDDGKTAVLVGQKNITEIQNTKLGELPSTGGMGTYLFTIVGVVLMACAAGAFFMSRKKTQE